MMEGLSWCSELRRGGELVVFGHPLRAAHASPSLREGEVWRCALFLLGSRVRGNDGWLAGMTDGLRE